MFEVVGPLLYRNCSSHCCYDTVVLGVRHGKSGKIGLRSCHGSRQLDLYQASELIPAKTILHPRAMRKLGCHEVELLGLSTCDWNSQHRIPHSALSPGPPHILTGSPVCCKAMWRQCRIPRECCVLDGEFSQLSLGQVEVDTNNAER
jgi:hypothetical protein